MSTATVPLVSGGGPVPVQVDGNAPAGCALINQDQAATIVITAGATGPTLAALQPGGLLVWQDRAVYPYAHATGGAGTVVLVVTDQASDYSNPAAVAAVTAAKLAAQGIPSTLLDTGYGAFTLPAQPATWQNGSYTPPTVDVGQSSTLILSAQWPQVTPAGAGLLQLLFLDPAVPSMPAQYLYLTADNRRDPGGSTAYAWQLPVLGPTLQVVNLQAPDGANAPAFVRLAGSNRPSRGLRQIGQDIGGHTLLAGGSFAAGSMTFLGRFGGTLTMQSRFTGPVTLHPQGPGAGNLFAGWIDPGGNLQQIPIPIVTGVNAPVPWNHPPVPVSWAFSPTAAATGNAWLSIVGANP